MASPVLPADAKAIIPDPSSSLCGNFVNALLRLPLLFYQFLSWLLTADGNLSTEVQKSITTLTIKPGDLIFSAGMLNTDGRLLCDGQSYSRTEQADLYAAIGTMYGSASPTTFNVPDFRDRFPIGVSGTKTVSSTGGVDEVTLTKSQMPTHSHGMRAAVTDTGSAQTFGFGSNSLVGISGRDGGSVIADLTEGSTSGFGTANVTAGYPIFNNGSSTPHTNMPPYMACYIFIKT